MPKVKSRHALAKAHQLPVSSFYYRKKLPDKDWALWVRIEEALRYYPSYEHRRLAIHLSSDPPGSVKPKCAFFRVQLGTPTRLRGLGALHEPRTSCWSRRDARRRNEHDHLTWLTAGVDKLVVVKALSIITIQHGAIRNFKPFNFNHLRTLQIHAFQ
jgi:hypothetical protein